MSTLLDEPRVSVADAASRLQVSRHTIRRWIREKRLPSVRLGGRRFVLERDLLAFVQAGYGAAAEEGR